MDRGDDTIMNKKVRYICITIAVIVISLAYSSKTIENLTLTTVSLTAPYSGIIESQAAITEAAVRIRTPVKMIIEDVYIKSGDTVKSGDKVVSLYPAEIDRQLEAAEDEIVKNYLKNIIDADYILTAAETGQVTEVKANTDGTVMPDDIIYKYIPYDSKTISQTYDTIVPLSAITMTGNDTGIIYFAIPLTGRGEAGQYIVSTAEVKLLAADGRNAAIDMVLRDDRQVIISSDKPITQGEKVKVR